MKSPPETRKCPKGHKGAKLVSVGPTVYWCEPCHEAYKVTEPKALPFEYPRRLAGEDTVFRGTAAGAEAHAGEPAVFLLRVKWDTGEETLVDLKLVRSPA